MSLWWCGVQQGREELRGARRRNKMPTGSSDEERGKSARGGDQGCREEGSHSNRCIS